MSSNKGISHVDTESDLKTRTTNALTGSRHPTTCYLSIRDTCNEGSKQPTERQNWHEPF